MISFFVSDVFFSSVLHNAPCAALLLLCTCLSLLFFFLLLSRSKSSSVLSSWSLPRLSQLFPMVQFFSKRLSTTPSVNFPCCLLIFAFSSPSPLTPVSLVFSSSAAVHHVLQGEVLSPRADENQGGAHQVQTNTDSRWFMMEAKDQQQPYYFNINHHFD